MANPEHLPTLDGFDRITVGLYRLALLGGAGSVGALGYALFTHSIKGELWSTWALSLFAALAATNLHLYDRRIRWLIPVMAVTGLLLHTAAPQAQELAQQPLIDAGTGALVGVLTAVFFKESFCFRLPGARLAPVLLVAGWTAMAAARVVLAGTLYMAAAALMLLVTGAKLMQPLGHDIGDRSRYQI